jgi:hypothetical protein
MGRLERMPWRQNEEDFAKKSEARRWSWAA